VCTNAAGIRGATRTPTNRIASPAGPGEAARRDDPLNAVTGNEVAEGGSPRGLGFQRIRTELQDGGERQRRLTVRPFTNPFRADSVGPDAVQRDGSVAIGYCHPRATYARSIRVVLDQLPHNSAQRRAGRPRPPVPPPRQMSARASANSSTQVVPYTEDFLMVAYSCGGFYHNPAARRSEGRQSRRREPHGGHTDPPNWTSFRGRLLTLGKPGRWTGRSPRSPHWTSVETHFF
jgi:hypothetical protein